MSLEERVGQMLMGGFHGTQAPPYFLDRLREGRLGGVILFARNVATPPQLAELTAQLHAAAKYPLLIAIDQEGGTVARLRDGFSESPGALALASIAHAGATHTEAVSGVLAREMQAVGINWTYAPVLDVTYNADNPTVGTRSFGRDPQRIGAYAAAAVRGFQANGVAACAKHFPGLGDTATDTHLALPRLDTSLEHLRRVDLSPYRACLDADLAAIMTTHTIFNALDAEHPATLSAHIVKRLIREELGFAGVVISDCMEMKAIDDHYGVADSAVLGAQAGLDILLYSHTAAKQAAAFEHLLTAVQRGDVPESVIDAANARIATLKARFPAQKGELNRVACPEHQHIMRDAARASVSLLRAEPGVLPLRPDDARRVVLVEFRSGIDSLVEESETASPLKRFIAAQLPGVKSFSLPLAPSPADLAAIHAQKADVLLIASRNAHLHATMADAVRALSQTSAHVMLLALRNPYDAALVEKATVFSTAGDSLPSLEALSEALVGAFEPGGRLPFEVL